MKLAKIRFRKPGPARFVFICLVVYGVLVCSGFFCACLLQASEPEQAVLQEPEGDKYEKILKMYKWYKFWGFSKINDLTPLEIIRRQAEQRLIFVDVRTPEEQEVSTVPNAIPYQEFDKIKEKYKDEIIIAYCTIGSRSGYYTKKLSSEGYNAYNMIGGILAWAHYGLPLLKDGHVVRRAHVYGRKWDLLPENYESIF